MPTAPEPPVSLEAESFDSLSQTLAPPSLGLPLPSLELDFTLRCRLNPRISLGQTPFGQRNWISFRGGEWVARWGKGEIVPGGQDSQYLTTLSPSPSSPPFPPSPSSPSPSSTSPTPSFSLPDATRILTSYLLRTDPSPSASPAYIALHTRGWRTASPSVMSRLLDSDPAVVDGVRPDEYFFRIFVEMETGDPELAGVVNGGMWVGSAARRGEEVIYNAYRVR